MKQRIKFFKNRMPMPKNRAMVQIYFLLLAIGLCGQAKAQQIRPLSLKEAIVLGIENSKVLKLSQAKIDEAISRYDQAKDNILPKANASYAYNHAEIPTTTLQFGSGSDIHLPKRADAYIGTLSVQELVFAGNKFRYAKQSTDLLTRVARLDAEQDKDEIVYTIVEAYYNLYKIGQSKKVVLQNLLAIQRELKQSQRFFEQGIVTKNDVLRFQLQSNNAELAEIDLESNKKIVNYNLDLLLGLPDNTEIIVSEFLGNDQQPAVLSAYIDSALANRQETKKQVLKNLLAANTISMIKADVKPTIGVGANLYYINANGKFIPTARTFIAPVSIGATIAWNFDKLWMNKNKIAEAIIQQSEAELGGDISADRIKIEVNRNYQDYLTALQRVKVYESSIVQATENDKILESKYRNNIASVTDRIDAQTQLFQTQINLGLAKADAGLAYYLLLKSTGSITKTK